MSYKINPFIQKLDYYESGTAGAITADSMSGATLTATTITATTFSGTDVKATTVTATNICATNLTATAITATNLTAVNVSATTYQNVFTHNFPTGIEFGNTTQEYDVDGTTWVTAVAGGTLGGIPDETSVGHKLADCLTSTSTSRDSKYLAVRENTGAASPTNPLTVQFLFSSVSSFNTVEVRERYVGSASHFISIQLWNYTSSAWDTFSTYAGEADYVTHTLSVYSPENYISAGNVKLQFIHAQSGVSTHYLLFDYVCISGGGGGTGGVIYASAVTNVASGKISSTSVQAALNELDTEKAALSGDQFTGALTGTNVYATTLTATTITATTFSGTDVKATTVTATNFSGTSLCATNISAAGLTASTKGEAVNCSAIIDCDNDKVSSISLQRQGVTHAQLYDNGQSGLVGFFAYTTSPFQIGYFNAQNDAGLIIGRPAAATVGSVAICGGGNSDTGNGNHLIIQGGKTTGAGAYTAGDLILRPGRDVSGGTHGNIKIQDADGTTNYVYIYDSTGNVDLSGSLSATTIKATTITATNVCATNFTATAVTATNITAVNISATTYVNLPPGGSGDIKADGTVSFTDEVTGTSTKMSAGVSKFVTLSATDISATSVSATTITATTFSGTDVKATTVTATTVSGAISADTVKATTVTATNLSSTNVCATTITATDFSGSNVKATTATATNLSSTNVCATTITATTFSGTDVKATTVTASTVSAAISADTVKATTITATTITGAVSADTVKATTVTATNLSSTNVCATTVTATTFSGTDVKATTVTATTVSGAISADTVKATTVTATTVSAAISADTVKATTVTATNLSSTNVCATTITATTFSGTNVKATTVTATDVSATSVSATTITATTFSGTNVKATTITATDVSATSVSATTITATTFSGASVKATTVTGTNLSSTNVCATTITATTFSGTDVKATTVTATNICAASFTATSVTATNITAVTICATSLTARSYPRVKTMTSCATPGINTDLYDCFDITALALNITNMTTNLAGTPVNFQKLMYRILDDGGARTIAWGTGFSAMGVPLPATTVAGKRLTVGFIFDTSAAINAWGCVASASQA